MGIISYQIPVPGQAFSTEAAHVDTALQTLLTWANGNVDETNVAAEFAQSAGVNVGGSGAKGVSVNAGPGTRTNTAYGALNDAADQVVGIVLPSNGLIAVWFQATWQESVAGNARAAIFIGANQLKVATNISASPAEVATAVTNPNVSTPLFSDASGLVSAIKSSGTPYSGDATTGQAVGVVTQGDGGPCHIFAAAGTYTVSVQYKAASGTVTASNRRLWVKAESFA